MSSVADLRVDQPAFAGFHSPNYTPVPDELFDELLSQLSGAELKVALYVMRRTFGFKKRVETISLKQIRCGITTRDGRVLDSGTGLSLSAAQAAIKGLVAKGVLLTQRNRSAERGDEATTYQLHMAEMATSRSEQPNHQVNQQAQPRLAAPVAPAQRPTPGTEKQQGGIPENMSGGYRKSAPQETGSQQTDLSVRISKAHSQENDEKEDGHARLPVRIAAPASPIPELPTPQPRTGSLRSLGEALAARQEMGLTVSEGPSGEDTAHLTGSFSSSLSSTDRVVRAPHGRIKPTAQIAVVVTEVSQEFGDLAHLAANCTQAMHLWEASGRSEGSLVSALYEARSITRQQPRVAKRIAYYWRVVRDLLGMLSETT